MLQPGTLINGLHWALVLLLGRDLVTWLLAHVGGLASRREAKTYAAGMLKVGYIRHVNKSSFSEKCYYVFADIVKSQFQFIFTDWLT